MHVLILGLFGLLGQFVPLIVARILTALGLGLVTGGALTYLLSVATGFATDWLGRIAGDALALVQIAGVHAALGLICSAFAVRVAWDATAITIKKVTG